MFKVYEYLYDILWIVRIYYRKSEWEIEWLVFNANSAIFQLYHGENKLIFNEMMMIIMRSDLY
jgi:hypothetical protein